MTKLRWVLLSLLVCTIMLNSSAASAANYRIICLSFPGASHTSVTDINAAGQIVGGYTDDINMAHGFLYANGIYTSIDFPGAKKTWINKINDSGQIIGGYTNDLKALITHGFLYASGVYTSIDFPGAKETWVNKINDSGQIIGGYTYDPNAADPHGFLYAKGVYTSIDYPSAHNIKARDINDSGQIVGDCNLGGFLYDHGSYNLIHKDSSIMHINAAGQILGNNDFQHRPFFWKNNTLYYLWFPGTMYFEDTEARGLNDGGQIVGWYWDRSGYLHGFLWSDGVYTTIDYPGAAATYARGINNSGQIVGCYWDSQDHRHGFLLAEGHYTTLDYPGAPGGTALRDITAAGQIHGVWFDAVGYEYPFIAIPTADPEPNTRAMVPILRLLLGD